MKNQQDGFWEDTDAASTHTSQVSPTVAAAAWFQGFHRLHQHSACTTFSKACVDRITSYPTTKAETQTPPKVTLHLRKHDPAALATSQPIPAPATRAGEVAQSRVGGYLGMLPLIAFPFDC